MVMGILGQSALILAVTAFSLAVTSLSRNMLSRLVRSYAALSFVISAWAFTFFLERVLGWKALYQSHLAFNLMVAPVGLRFARELTRVESKFLRALTRVADVYTVLVFVLAWTKLGTKPVIRNLENFGPSFLMIACVWLMIRRPSRTRVHRWDFAALTFRPFSSGVTGKSWIYGGALVILLSAWMDHAPWMGEVIPSIGNMLFSVYLFFMSEAVVHDKMLNVAALVQRVLVLIFISLCFALLYILFVAWATASPALFLLNSFLATFIILMLIDPARKLIGWAFVRVFSARTLELEARVQEAEGRLTAALDTQALAEITLDLLKETLDAPAATLYVLRADGTRYRRIRGYGEEESVPREIFADTPLVEYMRVAVEKNSEHVLLDRNLEAEIERTTSEERRTFLGATLQTLKGMNVNLILPFASYEGNRVRMLGFVAVNAPAPPAPWDDDWSVLSFLQPYFKQAARVLRNMDVYVSLKEKERLATLGEMAAGLAHEIRNPLGAIKGAAQLLEPQAGDTAPLLKVIIEETNRLNRVVTQFLDYSRPLGASLSETDVGLLLERTLALFESAKRSGEIPATISIELAAPAGGFGMLPKIRISAEQIKQVLVNLVQNSVQAIVRGGGRGTVKIGAKTTRPNDVKEIALFVEDDGPGIPIQHLEKIFIPFYTASPGGTGLGLSVSARIVEAHGGTIDVQAEEGKFTRFTVYLPVKGPS